MLKHILFTVVIFGVSAFHVQAETAATSTVQKKSVTKNPSFIVPQRLRPRVDFWRAVFTKYGKYQKVIHHRRYPQIIFKVLDFSKAASELSPNAYAALVKRVEEEKVNEIRAMIANLSRNGTPTSSMEKHIVEQMKFLPGGTKKYNDIVQQPELVRTQTGIKEKGAEAIERSGKYIKAIEHIFVNEAGLPKELTRLPFIESSFNYTAYSSVGAAGIWQFMPKTAKSYMSVNAMIDERLDPFIATRAATKYLRQAYNSLNDWGLAVTSYNHGIGGVHKKVKLAGTKNIIEMIERTSGDPIFGFASQNFWPEFLAAVEIFEDYKKHYPGLKLADPIEAIEYRVPSPMFLNQAAKAHGITTDALLATNYAILAPVASGKRPLPTGYILRVPTKGARILPVVTPTPDKKTTDKKVTNKKATDSKVVKKPVSNIKNKPAQARYVTVKKGQTLSGISKLYGIRIDSIKKLNNIKNNTIKAGQRLRIE